MRAGLRLGVMIAVAGLALGAVPALGQSAPEPATNTPATDSIGPRELQNFNLQGTVTQPAAQQPAPAPARSTTATSAPRPTESRSATPPPAPRAQASTDRSIPPSGEPEPVASTAAPRPAPARSQAAPSASVTVSLPPLGGSASTADSGASAPAPGEASFGPETETASLAPQHSFPLIPWLLAAIALGAGAAFLFWRNRSREAFAGGPQIDAYVAPEPTPAPRPRPAPAPAPKAAEPKPVGVVSTRLRPWVELGFQPLRCILDEEKVTFEFELDLFNSGSSPARDVLIEATLFNAGPTQDHDIGAFFENPVGQGQRIAAIPPLQRMNLRTEVSAPRNSIQLFEVAGRQVIVPLIAFNALYRWGVSEGQTSLSFLLGRDTKGDKLAPFRTDLGPRVFRGLGARPLPQAVRK